jgi:hypothetical protein
MDQGDSRPPETIGQLVLALDTTLDGLRQLAMALRTISPQIPLNSLNGNSLEVLRSPKKSSTGEYPEAKLNTREIGRRIRRRRQVDLGTPEHPFTIEELARLSGRNARTIGRWERGQVDNPNPAFLASLCGPLSCTLDWLLYGEETEHGNDRSTDHQG